MNLRKIDDGISPSYSLVWLNNMRVGTYKVSLWGEKSIGLIFSSNLLLGPNLSFLNTVHPIPARATIAATTMIAMNVVLGNPAIFSSVVAAAAEADAEAEAVTWTTVELREAVTTLVWTDRAVEAGAEDASSVDEDATATCASADEDGWASSEVIASSVGLGEAEATAADDWSCLSAIVRVERKRDIQRQQTTEQK
jgi:hypothetical protein